MTTPAKREPDWLGRGVGLVVFFVGIVLLVIVFAMIGTTLAAETVPLNEEGDPDYVRLGIDVGLGFGRLLLMGFVAGLIAGRGAQMYAAANRGSGD